MRGYEPRGGHIPPPRPGDGQWIRLSPGELYPSCCPGLVIVDHDDIGAATLLAAHLRDAHGAQAD